MTNDAAYKRAYYLAHKSEYQARYRRWVAANRERFNEIQNRAYHKRRARALAAATTAPAPSQPPPPQPKSLLVVWGSFTS
jgi:hypothetical protein